MADFVLKMPRGAQVVYPKDIGAILVEADVFPGARVLEAGTGSGALTLALCRATGPEGRVVSYELRPEFQTKAASNLEAFFGKLPPWLDLREGDVREVVETGETFDRVVLDMPEPWGSLEPAGGGPAAGRRSCAGTCRRRPGAAAVLALRTAGTSSWRPSRSCTAPGTSPTEASGRTTGWWPTPGFITVARRVGDAAIQGNRRACRQRIQRSEDLPGEPGRERGGRYTRRREVNGMPEPDPREQQERYEKQIHELQTQVKFLEDEVALLRRRLTNAPRQVKILEEKLLETRADLSRALTQNERLTSTLQSEREKIEALREEVEKLSQPPASFGVYLPTNEDGSVDVFTAGRKMRVNVAPEIEAADSAGAPRSS